MDLIPHDETDSCIQQDLKLLQTCYRDGEHAEKVWLRLEGLRKSLPPASNQSHLIATIEGVQLSCRVLRDIGNLSQEYKDRVPVVLHYVLIVCPSLAKTLTDMLGYYEDRKATIENRWRKMYHILTDEAEKLPLPRRFTMFNSFLVSLRDLLIRYVEMLSTKLIHAHHCFIELKVVLRMERSINDGSTGFN